MNENKTGNPKCFSLHHVAYKHLLYQIQTAVYNENTYTRFYIFITPYNNIRKVFSYPFPHYKCFKYCDMQYNNNNLFVE